MGGNNRFYSFTCQIDDAFSLSPNRANEPTAFDVAHNCGFGKLDLPYKDTPKMGEFVSKTLEPISKAALLSVNYLPKEVLNRGVRSADLVHIRGGKTLSCTVAAVGRGLAIAERSYPMARKGEEYDEVRLFDINFGMGSAVQTHPGFTREGGPSAVRVLTVSPALLCALDSVVGDKPISGVHRMLVLKVCEYAPKLVVLKGAQSGPVGARCFAEGDCAGS